MILLLETSASICSVALTSNSGEAIDSLCAEAPNSHAEKLPVLVQELLHRNRITLEQLDAVGINAGPGSYTGLRIGTSLAKGICYAAQLPLLGLNGLLSVAQEVKNRGVLADIYMVALDARRDELYMQIFDKDLVATEPLKAVKVDLGFFDAYSGKAVVFASNANAKVQELSQVKENILFVEASPEAVFLRWQAAANYAARSYEDLAYFEPRYLKDFIPGVSKKFSM